jgi:hypothetical protein
MRGSERQYVFRMRAPVMVVPAGRLVNHDVLPWGYVQWYLDPKT